MPCAIARWTASTTSTSTWPSWTSCSNCTSPYIPANSRNDQLRYEYSFQHDRRIEETVDGWHGWLAEAAADGVEAVSNLLVETDIWPRPSRSSLGARRS